MTWWVTLSGGLGILLAAFMTGAPIFIAFLAINITGVIFVIGPAGFGMVANSIFETTNIAALTAIPLFIMMGELLFRSGSVDILFDSVDKLVGRVQGRQYVLCILLSTIFGALSGAAKGVAAIELHESNIYSRHDQCILTGVADISRCTCHERYGWRGHRLAS